jgi:hypothetical protein
MRAFNDFTDFADLILNAEKAILLVTRDVAVFNMTDESGCDFCHPGKLFLRQIAEPPDMSNIFAGHKHDDLRS